MTANSKLQLSKRSTYANVVSWIVKIGWLGFGIVVASWIAEGLPIETTVKELDVGLIYVRLGVGLVWPSAVGVQLYTKIKSQLVGGVLAGLSIALTIPWFLLIVITSVSDAWQDEEVLYRAKENLEVRIAVQHRDIFVTTSRGYRVAKLTPLLDVWQIVEPVDTAHFDATGWQRVNQ